MRRVRLNSAISADNLLNTKSYFDNEFLPDIKALEDTVSDIQYVTNWLLKLERDRRADSTMFADHADNMNEAMIQLKEAIINAVAVAESADATMRDILNEFNK